MLACEEQGDDDGRRAERVEQGGVMCDVLKDDCGDGAEERRLILHLNFFVR